LQGEATTGVEPNIHDSRKRLKR